MDVCKTLVPNVVAPEVLQNDHSYVCELSWPNFVFKFSMIGSYMEDLRKPQNCQNWKVGACSGMGACTGMGACLGQYGSGYFSQGVIFVIFAVNQVGSTKKLTSEICATWVQMHVPSVQFKCVRETCREGSHPTKTVPQLSGLTYLIPPHVQAYFTCHRAGPVSPWCELHLTTSVC